MKVTYPKADDLEIALRTFIESGSANGNETMRRICLRLVPLFAAAPELLAQLKAAVAKAEGKR